MRVLIIEDDLDIAGNLYEFLEGRGNVVDLARDGVTGLHLAVSGDFDAIVLDLGLPGVDGLCLCRKLRGEAKQDVPILILTARDLLDDKLAAFECGADDYLVKPFALREVEARLNALVVRRRGRVVNKRLSYEAIEYDRRQAGGDGGRALGASFPQVPAPAGNADRGAASRVCPRRAGARAVGRRAAPERLPAQPHAHAAPRPDRHPRSRADRNRAWRGLSLRRAGRPLSACE
jgi:CheY-like chemotaxis protein